jgi:uncharacterized Ntn-hydrolase superfamily protein
MLTVSVLMLLTQISVSPALASKASIPARPVHTFSIVARDAVTGDIGVAVQSHWFSVGSAVPFAEAGVGAVATQSFVDSSYGPLGLDLMRAGKSAAESLEGLLAADGARDVRQVAMIDAKGTVATHTGKKCINPAGHAAGKNFSVQANMMANATVWPAMAKAFESASGDLGERMLAALDAAQKAGGDARGQQSAALIVVKGISSGKPWADRIYDLRVDDSAQPLVELRRLVRLQKAYNLMNAGDLAMEKKDADGALKAYAAAEKLAPEVVEMSYWHAVSLVGIGKVDEALALFKKTFAKEKRWKEMTPAVAEAGLLPQGEVLQRILKQ